MSVVNMTRTSFTDNKGEGATYHEKVVMTVGTDSDFYLIPVSSIYTIVASIDGDGGLYFTFDSQEEVETGSPDWYLWDGASNINLGITAFKLIRSTGTVTAKVTVKTEDI